MTRDPLTVLGLPPGATESEIRARYLELVKQFPPERDPERFREIHDAYQAAKDPLLIAEQLLTPTREVPPFSDVIDREAKNPPPLPLSLLLGIGNRDSNS